MKQLSPAVLSKIKSLPAEQQAEFLDLLNEYDQALERDRYKNSFIAFVERMWPEFIAGRHHKIMAEAFEKIARGDLKRLIINMPPRHTKSEFASYLLPAWFLGQYPQKKIIQSSHTAELAVGFGRKVRNLLSQDEYQSVFPDVGLRSDSKAAGRWNTSKGGDYFAIGIGGAVTGKGADLLIIDDPHSEQEGQSGDANVFEHTYEWYTSGPRQRLQPGGAIVIVMCMTGDTKVLMSDGRETLLKDLRPGDMVASYEDGRLTSARINNWQSSGNDSVYKIKTQSGRSLRANERHPFLVDHEGERQWVRLKDLMTGMALVSLKGATGLPGQKENPGFADHAKPEPAITGKTQTLPTDPLGIMANGRGSLARLMAALSKRFQKDTARPATQKLFLPASDLPKKIVRRASRTAMASLLSNTTKWLLNATIDAISAATSLIQKTPALIGAGSSASITVTIQGRSGGFSAMTATLPSAMARVRKFCEERRNTSSFTLDRIVEITPDGEDEVFDVEVDRTENFIANGVVSHNTRWSKKDLTGRIIEDAARRGTTDEWEVIEFPALLGDKEDKPLWPEFWSLKELVALKNELPLSKWMAQYMQQPTSDEAAIIKREWWQEWDKHQPPACDFIIQSWDTAFTKKTRSDPSACTTWGVFFQDERDGSSSTNIILLDAFDERMEFPELKRRAVDEYKAWEPDICIIEAKASGLPLIFEMRSAGIPVQDFTPSRGNDKHSRVNAVSDLFASGRVWAPPTRWAEKVIEQFADFPNGDHDDLVDSSTQALLRFRQGGFVKLHSDEDDNEFRRRRAAYY